MINEISETNFAYGNQSIFHVIYEILTYNYNSFSLTPFILNIFWQMTSSFRKWSSSCVDAICKIDFYFGDLTNSLHFSKSKKKTYYTYFSFIFKETFFEVFSYVVGSSVTILTLKRELQIMKKKSCRLYFYNMKLPFTIKLVVKDVHQ